MGHGLEISDGFEIEGPPLGKEYEILFDIIDGSIDFYVDYDIRDPEALDDHLLNDLSDIVLQYAPNFYDAYQDALDLYEEIRHDVPGRGHIKWRLAGNGDEIRWCQGGKGYAFIEAEWLEFIAQKILVPAGRSLVDKRVRFYSESGDGYLEVFGNQVFDTITDPK